MSRNQLDCAIMVVLILVLLTLPAREPVDVPQQNGRQIEWDLLGHLRAPDDSMRLLLAWEREEGADPGCFNPLNTTYDDGSAAINSSGVRCYASYEQGLAATVNTLAQPVYSDLVVSLQTDDERAFLVALEQSPWGTKADNVAAILAEWTQTVEVPAAPVQMAGRVQSNGIATGGDTCGQNVRGAIDTSPGLRDLVIAPGGSWSFNDNWKISDSSILYCAGVPGGNMCNFAARYAQSAEGLGVDRQFADHGVGDLGGGPENSVMIWSDGGPGGADLVLVNRTGRTAHFWLVDDGTQVAVAGRLE